MTKAEKTRQFIIEQSAPIFNTKGVAGTAMSDIMEATRLSKGSLYVHFDSKDELSYCTVDYIIDSLVRKAQTAVNKEKTAKDKLFAFVDFLGDPSRPHVTGGCPMLNFGMEADDTSPVILKKIHALVEGTQKQIASIVTGGINSGEFSQDWNASEFATKIFALLEGGIMISRIAGNNHKMKVIVDMIKKEVEEHIV